MAGPFAGPWLQKTTSQEGVVTKYTNNVLGEQVTVHDGANNPTSVDYDGLGRVSRILNADNTRRLFSYDGAGRTVQVENRNASNAVVTTEKAAYDDNGNLVASTDARQTTTTFGYDALDNVTSEVQPITATTAISTSFGYDAAGSRTRFTDGRNNAFWTTYNSWGLPESQIEPTTTAHPNLADRTYTTIYDQAARPVAQLAPGGVRIDNTYDDLHRLTGQTGTGAEAATTARSFGYDDAGRLTSFSAPNGTNSLSYDDRGLPLTINSTGNATSFGYTRDGQMASRTDAAGTTGYTYDVAGRLRTAANPTTGINLTIGYNTMSLPATITYGTNNNVRTFTYDALQRLSTDTLRTSNGTTTLGSISYGYDPNGNMNSKVTTGFAGASSNTYGYDLADRLTSWTRGSTVTAYAYDGSGNRTQAGAKTFSYDARNRLTAQTGVGSYVYTPRGTLSQTTSGSVTYQTSADAFGQVVSQQASGGTSTYSYDALGRAVQPQFRYTGLGNTLAQDGTATYTRGPGGELLGQGSGTGAGSAYAWTDQHRDVVGQFTATGTTLTGSTSYDPLGTILATSGVLGSLGYQSEWTDTQTGRVNMHARWYNPDTGQFDTRDTASNSPVPDSVAANRFQYGDANPMTTIDPTGHWGLKSFFKKAASVVTNPVATYRAVASKASSAFNYAASGRAWSDVKAKAKKVVSKAKKAVKVVKDSTVRWAKKKVNKVKDAYKSAKKCVSGGVGKCVKETAKKAVKKVVTTVKSTVEAIKKDPWKFVATAAVGLAAAVAVGALCATGVGCLILAGAVAGAMSAGAGYMVDVSRGDEDFSWSGLAGTMIEGGLDGALSGGLNRFGGGAKLLGGANRAVRGGSSPAAAASRQASTGGGRSGGTPAAQSGPGGGGSSTSARPPRAEETSSSGGTCSPGKRRHSFDPATLVLLADGTARPIGDVQPGDEVVATDPETGETSAEPVTQLHVNVDRELTNVTVRESGAERSVTLETTAHHPFWDATDREWVDAGKLQVGHRLLVHDDKRLEGDGTGAGSGGGGPGREVTVVAVDNFTGSEVMRDLTIATHHTYYVIAGDTPVLVHNCGGSDPDHADRCLCATGGPTRLAVKPGEVGSFGDLNRRSRVGDGLTPDHIPQAASGRLANYDDYAAVMLTDAEHALTRDFRGKGIRTKRLDAGLSFREVVALKLWNYRSIGQQLHGDPSYFNESIKGVLAHYRTNFPNLGV